MSVEYKNLNEIDFTKKKDKVSSPRSLEALKLLGIPPDDLFQISFKDFLYKFPELKSLPQEQLQKRFNHFEEKRQGMIREAINKRQELINSPLNTLSAIKSKTFFKKIQSLNDGGNGSLFQTAIPVNQSLTSTALDMDNQRFERMKQNQMNEMQLLIDYEFKLEEIRENNQKKMQIQKELEDKIKAEKLQRMNEENYRKRIKELEKQKKDKEDLERKNALMLEKQKLLESKDMNRNNLIEQKKKEMNEQSRLKASINEKRLALTMEKLDKQLQKQIDDFENKQKYLEENRRKFLMKKDEEKRIQMQINLNKEEEIEKIMKRNREMENMKAEKYYKKMMRKEELKKLKEEEIKRATSEKLFFQSWKENKLNQTRYRYESIKEEYRNKLIKKLQETDVRIERKKFDNMISMKTKFDDISVKREDKREIVERKERTQEYLRHLKMEELFEKMQKFDDIKKQKEKIAIQKKFLTEDMKRKKQNMYDELQNQLHKGKIDKNKFYLKLFGSYSNLNNSMDAGRKTTNQHENSKSLGSNDYDRILEKETRKRCPLDTSSDLEDENPNPNAKKISEKEIKQELKNHKEELENQLNILIRNNKSLEDGLSEKIEKESNLDEKRRLEDQLKSMKSNHEELVNETKMKHGSELADLEKNLRSQK